MIADRCEGTGLHEGRSSMTWSHNGDRAVLISDQGRFAESSPGRGERGEELGSVLDFSNWMSEFLKWLQSVELHKFSPPPPSSFLLFF